ncbi:NAD(P)H oxidase (H2O2-forming) [Caenorhabditis elegans]|uniref:NAD(P)H oxidase (H2O2-forming) n=1 Tax=Caenorhabditis elegans TaxID=6239 RepID=O01795_CAEEL|nr:NAD(P)H oxidase (H2O2-forming) [Caenorhabditis elegans]CCD71702.1 NAD(P)H oxidase (H2O2-forming) [Caenorhabditis elegans]|eukprot:NP_490684.1 DUal OXidase [Caenorhabditis elegans]
MAAENFYNVNNFQSLPLEIKVQFSKETLFSALQQEAETQRYDGWYNNLANSEWGSAGSRLHRDARSYYSDGVYSVNNSLPSARELSDILFKGESGIPNTRGCTTLLAFFSQVVAYEIMQSNGVSCPLETLKIQVPLCDNVFDNECEGKTTIPFYRAKYDKATGNGLNSPREQINERTSWIDGSFIYGTTQPWVSALRSFKQGRLAEGVPGYPPLNNPHIPLNNPAPPQVHRLMSPDRLFMLGDSRVNENPGLLSFGLILFRWHNYNANQIYREHPDWTDEQIFQAARRLVIASMQKIIAYDFVPGLLGEDVRLSNYTKYMPHVPPGISHAFGAAAFRFPHSIVPPAMLLRKRGNKCEFRTEVGGYPALRLCQNWWNAQDIVKEYSVDEIILGMASQIAERDDNIVVEDLRDYIFGPMHFSRLDVVASSIMRGRDNGVPPYNELRRTFGLAPKTWETMNEDFYKKHTAKVEKLKELYGGNILYLDAYVGGMLEGGENGPGEMFKEIIKDQFTRIRDGDRFWFENKLNRLFTDEEVQMIHSITLRDIIKATTDIDETMLQKDVFFFKEGDPCPQPFQVNTIGLEPCAPLIQSTYWDDNDTTYIYTLIGLACIPLICYSIGHYMVERRIRIGHNSACDSLTTDFSTESPKVNVYKVNALEWLQEEYIRQVRIEIENTTLTVKKPRGGILRKIRFETGQKIEVFHSIPNPSAMHGPFVLLSQKNNHHLVIRLSSDRDLSKFLDQIRQAASGINAEVIIKDEENSILLSQAITKERRQDRLDLFFREAYAKAFNDSELQDSETSFDSSNDDILNETISREELASAMGMKANNEFVKRMFAMTAKHNEDSLSFNEFLTVLREFVNAPQKQKLQTLFKMCDLEGKNKVLRKDLAELVKSLNQTAGVHITESVQLRLFNDVLHKSGVSDDAEYLTCNNFDALFSEISDVQPIGLPFNRKNYNSHIKEPSCHTSFPIVDHSTPAPLSLIQRICAFLETYRQHVFIIFCFVAINIVLFFELFWHSRYLNEDRDLRRVMGAGIAITLSSAGALSFCMALILLTVCRNIITLLRETVIAQYIPFDSAIAFHKIVALFTLFWSTLHTIGHCVNFYHVGTQSDRGLACLFQETFFGSDVVPTLSYWFYGTITGLTGIGLVIVMSIIYVFALPKFTRRAYHAFRLTHLLNIGFYALTILHGLPSLFGSPKFGYYVVGPIVLFVIDRIIGLMQYYKSLDIAHAEILPSDIIYIEYRRPREFEYKSGQWITVSSPSISCTFNESHAFSIASSPQDENMKLYIKAVGPWTWKLRSELIRSLNTGSPFPLIHMKGPYGDGNQEWMNYEVAIMVGAGIGVTPYASTLVDLVQKTSSDSFHRVRCRKVYFLWVCSSHKNFEWFVDMLKNVENQAKPGILETHIFVTQMFHKFDLRTTMLYICEKHFRATNSGISMFTGLHAKNHFGRPNFKAFFQFIQSEHKEQSEIGVFSCGPVNLNESIAEGCADANRQRDAPSFAHRFETF